MLSFIYIVVYDWIYNIFLVIELNSLIFLFVIILRVLWSFDFIIGFVIRMIYKIKSMVDLSIIWL